jgi:penicillin amidase
VAWGGTVVNHDVTDFYLEEIVPCAAGGGDCVVFEGGEVAIETVEETIRSGALGTFTDSVTVTLEQVPHHGPIIPTVVDHQVVPRTEGSAISMRFTGYQETHDVRAFARLWRARTVQEGIDAMDDFKFGGQNWVMADSSGNIGWTTTALVPWRSPACFSFHATAAPDGVAPFFVVPGDGTCEWEGWMDARYIPHALNPAQGYLATANADPVGATFDGDALNGPVVDGRPLYAGALEYANGLRVGRITRRLEALREAGSPMTMADMAAIQTDAYSNNGALLAPHIVAAVAAAAEEAALPGTHPDLTAFVAGLSSARRARLGEAADWLASWSFATSPAAGDDALATEIADSVATSIFNHWMVTFLPLAFADEIGLLGESVGTRHSTAAYALFERAGDLRTGLHEDTGEPVLCDDLDTPELTESCTLLVVTALDLALTRMAGAGVFGTDEMDAWRWGELHRVTLDALLPADELDIPPPDDPDRSLRRGYSRHGDVDAVDASSPGYGDFDFTFDHGPAMRHVTEFLPGAGPKSWIALPGGASHDRASGHFRDLMDAYWSRDEYLDLPFSAQEILGKAESRTRLAPE